MSTSTTKPDLTQIMLSVLFISALAFGSFWVLRPFLSALIWAVMIVIPTWPLMMRLTEKLGGRRVLATLILTLALCLLVFIPVWFAIRTVVVNSDTIAEWASKVSHFKVSTAPQWVSDLPVVGNSAASTWNQFALAEHEDIESTVTPYLVSLVKWFPSQLGNAGAMFIHFLLMLVLCAILYLQGDIGAAKIIAFARRLAGDRGEQATILAAQAIKAVAMGIVVTAMVQALVAGVGLALAGIPFTLLLTALIFFLSIVQIGAGAVLVPTIIWLYWSGSSGWGTFILIWSVLVMGLDNFLRPFLIKRGADLPMLLIFAGVIGGVLTFGILGLFIGPVILAVSYTLLEAWVGAGTKKFVSTN
ncbi:MAG: AI-2E family transporter YdiK [Deltaproteobacteria bacterium]|nr:AI-2E family transporter YdiK [Deltaproteobacteria bacterium]